MNCSLNFDWKFVLALGASTGIIILATKISPSDAEKVSLFVVDTCKSAFACESEC